jgi:hypothetical protein
MLKRITFLLILLTNLSCKKTEYTLADCEELSMKKFKGYTRESHQFDKNCGKFKIHYTGFLCQLALKDLILGTPLIHLEKKHGEKISHCFTENDLKKFSI